MKSKNLDKYFKYLKDKFTEVTINIDENNENEYNKTKNLLYLFLEIIIKSKKPEEFLMSKFEKKLDEKVYFELYIKILETVFEDKKKDLIKYIFQKMKKNINIKYTLMFAREINNEKLKKQYFDELKELKELFFFKYEDFFSEKNHKGIELFIALTEKDCMYKNCDFYNENMKVINQLKDKFNELTIKKPQVEELFNKLNEETILERLKLICENQNEMYNKIKSKLKEVKKEIDYLENMKNLLSIYHKKEIEKNKDLTEIIKSLNEEELNKIDEKMKKINEIKEKYKDLIELIKKVKDSKFFSIIYKITQEKEEKDKKCFKESIEILKNQKNIIKDPEEVDNIYLEPFFSTLKNNEIKDEIKRLCNFYEDSIDNDLLEDKFLVLINKEKYCKVIESILFFLDKIEANKTKFSEELNNFIDDVKKKKGKYEIIKKYLTSFNKEGIFDYLDENSNKYLEFFKHLENKELAIAFLLKKNIEEANALEERIDPFETTITNQDINVFKFCIEFFENMDYENLTDIEILKYIKETIKKDISILDKFKIYSNNYISLKELDENFDETTSVFKNVEDNINTGIYYFYKNRDEYIKNESNPQNNEEEKRYEYLYDLRCKINNEIDQAEEKDEKLKEKHSKLKYFYNLVDKIGKIKNYVDSFRNKVLK